MLASTFMDMVLGLDIHFEMVPMPAPVPTSALTIDQPVPSAFDRRTESVPSTTQKPCWTPVR